MPKKKKKYRSETLYFGWFFSFWKLLARNDDECISAVLKYVPLIAVPSIFLWIIHLQNKNLVIIIIASKANQKHEHLNNECGLFRENIVRSYAHFSIDCNLFLTTVLGVQTERKKTVHFVWMESSFRSRQMKMFVCIHLVLFVVVVSLHQQWAVLTQMNQLWLMKMTIVRCWRVKRQINVNESIKINFSKMTWRLNGRAGSKNGEVTRSLQLALAMDELGFMTHILQLNFVLFLYYLFLVLMTLSLLQFWGSARNLRGFFFACFGFSQL